MDKEIFKKNKECMILIPEIIRFFRKQMYFQGSKRVQVIIKHLRDISNYVLASEGNMLDKQEWLTILQVFLEAQENKDYILMSDVMESDLLEYLQRLQNHLLSIDFVLVNDCWEKNMQSIKAVDPSLYKAINKGLGNVSEDASVQFEPMFAINGQPTLKAYNKGKIFCMHSTINPEWEAKELAESWRKEDASEYRVFGMGMGYHVKALLDTDDMITVTVLEYRVEVLRLALTYLDLETYFRNGRLKIIYETNLIKLLQQIEGNAKKSVFFLHHPSMECVESQEIRELLEDYFIKTSSMLEQGDSLYRNFNYLQSKNLPECTELKGVFENKNIVIVAGGPSVDDELENLKKYRDEISILSVGTVASKLIQAGIEPDAIIVTDPQDTMYRQVEAITLTHIPLILLCSGSKTILDVYRGPVYLAYQYGFELAEAVAKERGYTLFNTGGSVTTTALDVAITFGAQKIILVGADMAFTDNHSHAKGQGYEIKDDTDYRKVPSVVGGTVYTSRNLDIYRKWIERRIKNLKNPCVYNTSRGARIAGTIERGLEEIMLEK